VLPGDIGQFPLSLRHTLGSTVEAKLAHYHELFCHLLASVELFAQAFKG